MARKKGDKNSRQTSMVNNPFKHLKGFSVSASKEKPNEIKDKPVAGASRIAASAASFDEEMERLGVRRMGKADAADVVKPSVVVPATEPSPPAGDEELFAAALGKLDTVFTDQYPDDEQPVASAPRRMKQLRRGNLRPEATLDLHGATRSEAQTKVRYFLEDAVYHGLKVVLIITGWGRGSGGGEPVLRGGIEQYLDGAGRALVAEWGRAPKQYGGDGALVVFLKSAEKVT